MLPLFLVDQIPDKGELVIEGEEARHAISALRISVGEKFQITNGFGRRAEVEAIEVSKRNLAVKLIDVREVPAPRTKLVVVQALTKGDRAKETIELLTEGGVSEIIPWQAARSIGNWRKNNDALSKWNQWAREATKQSRRSWLPQVSELMTTSQVVNRISNTPLSFLFHEDGGAPISTAATGNAPSEILVIIGPEGGITPEESEVFSAAGAKKVVMGEAILRSAHAGIAALAAIQTSFGIW